MRVEAKGEPGDRQENTPPWRFLLLLYFNSLWRFLLYRLDILVLDILFRQWRLLLATPDDIPFRYPLPLLDDLYHTDTKRTCRIHIKGTGMVASLRLETH